MKMTEQHADALKDLLTWRRDVRHFSQAPVSPKHLDQLRAAMDLAPSVGNARPWRIIRVLNPALRAQVRDEFSRCNAEAASDYSSEKQEKYLKLKLAGLDNAPEQLAIFTEIDPSEGHGLGRKTIARTLEQSTAMAVYNLWLTARALNLGVGMLSILDPTRMQALFETPAGWQFTAYLCIGQAEFDDDTPLLHREDWQANTRTNWETR
ncbi:5,6-dimethylbenzimidazole synthase [Lentibacter algarum]|uniref:5,6-dimethylbenzimidazole synthase n=1 Tax=Lentibacter algarum TaxID=576131 RepID=UPI001C069B46|nr:5,6-dimethylbenzimidazole synthase [Lentibacter algarum]MBU2981662.1 5,6-dimethylbenzimidazole synthase [Lentibacter algarum]